jgi:hypothetical protein
MSEALAYGVSYENVLPVSDFHPSMSEAVASWACRMKIKPKYRFSVLRL